jgi:ubiquinone/menaquinone biosynthesis C-methylase UbiE
MVTRRRLLLIAPALVVCAWTAAGVVHADRDEWQQPDRVMADLAPASGAVVADVGCGSGYFTGRLARAVGETGRVYAADIDAKALGELQKQVERDHLANVTVILSEPTDTKLPSASLDAALLCDVLHEAPEAVRAPLVRDIARALKPGGFLFLIDYRKSREVPFDPYDKLIPREDLLSLGEQAGLTLDAEFHYLRYQVFLRFRRPPR